MRHKLCGEEQLAAVQETSWHLTVLFLFFFTENESSSDCKLVSLSALGF